MRYTIDNGVYSLTVDTRGAEIVSAKKDGKEWVWQNDDGNWSGHGPMLFPVCGHCGVRVNGVDYPIKAHGFAKKSNFKLVERGENFLRFFLQANEKTKKVYPFDFQLYATYTLSGDTVYIEFDVRNPSKETLYFACGGHESFNLEKPIGEYEIRFEKEETLVHLFHDDDGCLTGETKNYGKTDTLVLPADFLVDGNTLIFKDLKSRKVTLAERGGKPLAEIAFPDFSKLLFWHALDSKYICIEPWTNLPDPADTPDIEFSQKEGVLAVAPKSGRKIVRSIRCL